MALERWVRLGIVIIFGACSGSSVPTVGPVNLGPPWAGFANQSTHAAQSSAAAQPLVRVLWQTPVDLAPPYKYGVLGAHYGSPAITPANTVLVPVKTGAAGAFRVEARDGSSGTLRWQYASDYVLPAHNWIPAYNLVLTGSRIYFPGAGGKLFYRENPDSAAGTVNEMVFYGLRAYAADKNAYDTAVQIDTPITADMQGDLFFGFSVSTSTPIGLRSGIAKIAPNGQGAWVSAAAAAGDAKITGVAMNAAPALSKDQQTLYVAVTNGTSGYLLALNSATLHTESRVSLIDPSSKEPATLTGDSTSSPTVGPDGDVYYGVLETPLKTHNVRGWLLHFDGTLAAEKTPGSFGWDDTASIVPSAMVPSYKGTSRYLLMTKYNNYGGVGSGNGLNEIAVLDPGAAQPDPIIPSVPVMKEVLTILGPTPDPGYPGGVREWCINTAAVDPSDGAIFANSEDGNLYRWDMATNSFTQRITLTSGLGEAYTPTAIGPDGQVYAINNAVLFAIGS